MSQASDFFDARYGDGTGLAVITLRGTSGQLTQDRYFRWPSQREELLAYVERNKAKDVYTCDGLMKAERRTKGAVKWLSSVQCDVDDFDPKLLLLEPSELVHTSEGRTHAHWDITDCNDPEKIEELAHAVSAAHPKTQEGVDWGWARNKVIRVPGTSNLKYEEPQEVWSEKSGLVYTYAEFAAAYPPVPSTAVNLTVAKEMGELPSKAEALRSIKNPSPKLSEMLDPTGASEMLARAASASECRFLLENELIRHEVSDEAMYVILSEHPFRSKKTDTDLWSDIQRARAKALAEIDPEVPRGVVVTVEPPKLPKTVDFLTREEKDSLQSNFITQYLTWATSRTDAFPGYHVAGAFETLSVVLSDHGHAVTSFAPKGMPLNLWFMVLGDTTRSRKSTARDFMLEMLNELSDGEKYQYELASSFTSEGLDNRLLTRPHRSGLVHVDEFQARLDEMNQKAYLSGQKGHLAQLYDGRAMAKLRSTGLQQVQQTVRTSFCLFTLGIRDQIADIMTPDDFRSGFLARFLYVQAEPPKRKRGQDSIRQPDKDTIRDGDAEFRSLIDGLRSARDFWEDMHEPGSPTVPVPFTDEALDRLNWFRDDLLDAAEGHERREILMATSERMAINMMKAATLLAMYECCDEVQVRHVIQTIAYGAEWFEHMVFMAEKISSSQFWRTQRRFLEFIAEKGDSATKQAIHRKFKDLAMSQILHALDALRESGFIYHDEEDTKIIHLSEVALQELRREPEAA